MTEIGEFAPLSLCGRERLKFGNPAIGGNVTIRPATAFIGQLREPACSLHARHRAPPMLIESPSAKLKDNRAAEQWVKRGKGWAVVIMRRWNSRGLASRHSIDERSRWHFRCVHQSTISQAQAPETVQSSGQLRGQSRVTRDHIDDPPRELESGRKRLCLASDMCCLFLSDCSQRRRLAIELLRGE